MGIGKIASQHRGLDAMFNAQIRSQRFQAIGAPGCQHQVVSTVSQRARKSGADAGGGSCDQAERACLRHAISLAKWREKSCCGAFAPFQAAR
jgi:hypothetical protein